MLFEVLVFVAALLTTGLYLMCSQLSRNKQPVNYGSFTFYKWAGEEVVNSIEQAKLEQTDFLRSGKSVMGLTLLGSFSGPLAISMILL